MVEQYTILTYNVQLLHLGLLIKIPCSSLWPFGNILTYPCSCGQAVKITNKRMLFTNNLRRCRDERVPLRICVFTAVYWRSKIWCRSYNIFNKSYTSKTYTSTWPGSTVSEYIRQQVRESRGQVAGTSDERQCPNNYSYCFT